MTASSSDRKMSSFNIMSSMYKNEGLASFFKGWTPAFIRLAPQTIITFVVLEQFKKWHSTWHDQQLMVVKIQYYLPSFTHNHLVQFSLVYSLSLSLLSLSPPFHLSIIISSPLPRFPLCAPYIESNQINSIIIYSLCVVCALVDRKCGVKYT